MNRQINLSGCSKKNFYRNVLLHLALTRWFFYWWQSRKLQEHGWKPRWFERDGEGPFRYIGGYWETREQGTWNGCPDVFGEITEDLMNSLEPSQPQNRYVVTIVGIRVD